MPSIPTWPSRDCGRRSGDGLLPADLDDDKIVLAYRKGVAKGMLKVMAMMGISTLQSYKGGQIFEAVGLRDEVIDRCFAGTASRIQGVGFSVIAEELLRRHNLGYPSTTLNAQDILPNPGEFHWRADGERHMWDPQSIADLQVAARNDNADAYQAFFRTFQPGCSYSLYLARTAGDTCRVAAAIRSAGRGGAGQRDREAVLYGCHEFRIDLRRIA